MNNRIENIEWIIKYLDDEMSPKEARDFEHKLFTNENLQKDFIMIKDIEENLKNALGRITSLYSIKMAFEEKELQEEIQKAGMFYSTPVKWYHSLYKAAALVVIILGSVFIIQHLAEINKLNTSYLFDKYFSSYSTYSTDRDNTSCYKTLAFEAYSKGEYKESARLFNMALPADSTLLFHIAMINLECKDYNSAIKNLENFHIDDNDLLNILSKWYIALAYLKINRPEKAKPYLKWLIENDRFYGSKSSQIIKELAKR